MSLPFLIENLPSLRVEARFGHSNSRKPSLNLISCAIFSQILTLAFTFYPRDYYVVLRFRNFCILAYYRLRVYYEQTHKQPSINHKRVIFPLLRILREIIDDFDTSIPLEKPTEFLYTNCTKHNFLREGNSTNSFKTFLNNLYLRLETFYNAAVDVTPDSYNRINELLFPLDQAYCMVLAYTYFFIPLESNIISNDFNKTAFLITTRFDQYRKLLPNRPLFKIKSLSAFDECKCQ